MPVDALIVACPFCKAAAASPCVYVTGPNAGKPRGASYGPHADRAQLAATSAPIYDAGYSAGYTAGAGSRQGEVDAADAEIARLAGLQVKAAAELAAMTLKANVAEGNVTELRDQCNDLKVQIKTLEARIADLTKPPVVVTEPKRLIPPDALYVHPGGNDANPGTQDKPRATAKPDAYNVLLGGTYNGYAQFLANGTRTTLHVPDGQTAVLAGQGKKRAITAGGVLNLYGNGVITGYAPDASATTNAVALYFGGTAAGSEIDGWTIEKSSQAALGFQVPLTLTALTVTDCGYSGILGTTADGTTLGDVKVLRINQSGRTQDGQLGAIKFTRSKDVTFTKGVHVEDTGGAVGLWCDVSCRTPHFTGSRVKTGAGKVASIGLLFEQTQGGTVTGVDVEGIEALRIAATGGLKIWDSKFVGTSIAARLWQDRNRNSGTQPANLPPTDAPWWTVDNEIGNTKLTAIGGLKIALTAYSSGDAKGQVLGKDMAALRGNRYNGSIKLGDATGTQITHTLPMLAAALGNRYSA